MMEINAKRYKMKLFIFHFYSNKSIRDIIDSVRLQKLRRRLSLYECCVE